jgi:hypothetical protein
MVLHYDIVTFQVMTMAAIGMTKMAPYGPDVARFNSMAAKETLSKSMYKGQKLRSLNRNVRWGRILQSVNYC